MGSDSATSIDPIEALDREWSEKERAFFVALPDRAARSRAPRLPRAEDVSSFRAWALVFAAVGAIGGFVLKLANPSGSVFAVGAGFTLFAFVAGIYAWLFARRLDRLIAAHTTSKAAFDARRDELRRAAESRASKGRSPSRRRPDQRPKHRARPQSP
ncbi:MAG: hypothetical protein U0414_07965 [Polyangiaceae bacterium]